jgi:TonB-dependent receptor
VTVDLIVRAGFSQSFSRAPFNVLAPAGESVSFGGSLPTITTSNPDILPRTSDNYDISAEYYIDEGKGILAAAIFYKKIENDFITVTETIDYDLGAALGGVQQVDIKRPGNSDFEVNVYGLELNLVKSLSFLPVPGFSISANATFLDTNGRDPNGNKLDTLLAQANEVYNVALLYSGHNIDARLAYNNTGKNLFQIRGNPDEHVYIDRHQQIDLKISYAVTNKLGVSFNAWNLTDEERHESAGRFNELPRRIEQYGRAFFGGVSYSY